METRQIQIYDTTLRDGTQREGISLSSADKLKIARKLDDLGVSFIEGGWPGSNPKDVEFFHEASKLHFKHALIAAFGATCRAATAPENDSNLKALLQAKTPVCTIVGKTWTLHVKEVLRTQESENLRMIQESVAYLRQQQKRVIYDAEHFFAGYKDNPEYALATLKAAITGGAETLVLCDTNGELLPWEVTEIFTTLKASLKHPLGFHGHNDSDCAVANTLAAVKAGAIQVQGTINGYGERCGNANLCSVIADVELKLQQRCLPAEHLDKLYEISHFVAEIANLAPDEHLPFVGHSAFAHKGGIHTAAMQKNPATYQHIDPRLVGNQMRVVVSELAGKSSLTSKLAEYGLNHLEPAEITQLLSQIKNLEAQGYAFEAAEASLALMVKRQAPAYTPPFTLIDFSVSVEHRHGRGIFAEATVKVRVGTEIMHTAAEGNGPVSALDQALKKALVIHYPEIRNFALADYKVRIIDSHSGTNAITRVLIDMHHLEAKQQWSTVGASPNIIEASWHALADAVEYGLTRKLST